MYVYSSISLTMIDLSPDLIPELCAKSTVQARSAIGFLWCRKCWHAIDSLYRSALLLPSITRRIDDLLLVKELNTKFFSHKISEGLLHVAICAPSAGYEYDYERLELLGPLLSLYADACFTFLSSRWCLLKISINCLRICYTSIVQRRCIASS